MHRRVRFRVFSLSERGGVDWVPRSYARCDGIRRVSVSSGESGRGTTVPCSRFLLCFSKSRFVREISLSYFRDMAFAKIRRWTNFGYGRSCRYPGDADVCPFRRLFFRSSVCRSVSFIRACRLPANGDRVFVRFFVIRCLLRWSGRCWEIRNVPVVVIFSVGRRYFCVVGPECSRNSGVRRDFRARFSGAGISAPVVSRKSELSSVFLRDDVESVGTVLARFANSVTLAFLFDCEPMP